jgi:hypothetical protein
VIDTASLRAWLGTSESDDALIEDLERAAVAYVERRTGRYFGPTEEVIETLYGDGGRRLWLSDVPADDAVSVVDADGATLTDVTLRRSGTEAWLERPAGLVWGLPRRWSGYPMAYTVTYQRGYAEGDEPADIRRAVMAWVARQWALRGKDGLAGESIGGYSYTIARDLGESTGDLDALLAPWIRPVIA